MALISEGEEKEKRTGSTDGAHLMDGSIRPAPPTVAAALHLGHELGVLVGAATIQEAGEAVSAPAI